MKKILLPILCFSAVVAHAQVYPTSKECKDSHIMIDGMKVMMVTEEMARYKSEEQEMMRTILDNFHYPKKEKNPPQKILVEFVIDTVGQVRNACIVRTAVANPITEYEKEVLRVVNELKDWTPAKHQGNKVPVLISLPITIDLKK